LIARIRLPAANALAARPTITAQEALTRISRDLHVLAEEKAEVKKTSLLKITSVLFEENELSSADYAEVFHEICKPIFRLYADPIEKCRELAFRLTDNFFRAVSDLVPVLGYFMPALTARAPSGVGYDEDMKVFVFNLAEHEQYRRGRAVERQDKLGTAGPVSVSVVEPSEEIRLLVKLIYSRSCM